MRAVSAFIMIDLDGCMVAVVGEMVDVVLA
jgi:hypothetical protein